MSYQGVDVRATTDRLMFRSLLLDSAGIVVTAGPTVLRLYEVQSDGTLKSFDFNDFTFKATALTTPTLAMAHCTGDAGTHNTGVWTVAVTTLTGFTVGGIYLGEVYNATASPITQVREFQFGNAEGDLVVNAARLNVDATAVSTSTTAADRLEGALAVATGIDLNMGQAVPNPGTVDTTGRALRTAHDMSSLTTGFSATAPNNLNSYLKAMMSKAAVVPTGMGTYDPATDTLEVLRERLDLMTGSGFSTGTDSLAAIRDAIDTLLAPVVLAAVGAGSVGFLAECVSLVRRATDEPSITPKYTDADIIEYIHSAFDQVLAAVNIDTDHPILVRHNISVVNGTQEYVLPCSVGEIWRLAKIDTTTQLPVWELWPSNEYTFAGYGFTIEDNILRFGTPQVVTQTLQLLYMPSSEVSIHMGTASSATASTIVFPAVPTAGSLDIRPNGYAGYVVRVLSGTTGAGQDRVINTYDAVTRTATVRPAWTTTPTGTMVYEVLPQYSRLIKHVVVDYAALDVLSNEAKSARRGEIEKRIQRKMTALRNTLSKKVNRFGSRGPGVDTIDNQDLWPMIP
jgi:hypothetical protein